MSGGQVGADRHDWRDDALAPLIPDPTELGDGWQVDDGRVVSPEPGGDQEIPGCDIPSPVTPPGIEVIFGLAESQESIEIQLMSGTVEEAAAWPSAFRALADCDLSGSGLGEMLDVAVDVEGADDAVVLEFRVVLEDVPDPAGGESPTRGLFAVATYDELVVGVLWVSDEGAASPADVAALVELIASKR